jgi:hypothetical protein
MVRIAERGKWTDLVCWCRFLWKFAVGTTMSDIVRALCLNWSLL